MYKTRAEYEIDLMDELDYFIRAKTPNWTRKVKLNEKEERAMADIHSDRRVEFQELLFINKNLLFTCSAAPLVNSFL